MYFIWFYLNFCDGMHLLGNVIDILTDILSFSLDEKINVNNVAELFRHKSQFVFLSQQ